MADSIEDDTMAGFYYPRTASGKSAILPPVPWHYSGELITLEYRTDIDAVKALLPEGVELAQQLAAHGHQAGRRIRERRQPEGEEGGEA